MLAAITLILAQATSASPLVHLECQTVSPRGIRKDWQITLNEAQGTVDYYSTVSGPQRRPARFTPTTVHFIDFTISRTDLTISRPVTSIVGNYEGVEEGQCRLAQPQDRAF